MDFLAIIFNNNFILFYNYIIIADGIKYNVDYNRKSKSI